MKHLKILSSLVLTVWWAACTTDNPPAAAPIRGTGPAAGGPSMVTVRSDSNADPSPRDGGADAAERAACPPSGRYRRISQHVEGSSDPRCELKSDTEVRAFFGPITQAHRIDVGATRCTVQPDTQTQAGCVLSRATRCDDGTSTETRCEVAADGGGVRCVVTSDLVTLRCDVVSEYVRDATWNGGCDAIVGPYTRTAELTAGGPDCPRLEDMEIPGPQQLSIDPRCTFLLPDPDGRCSVTAFEECNEGAGTGASHRCTVSADASDVMCSVERGACRYQVTLVR